MIYLRIRSRQTQKTTSIPVFQSLEVLISSDVYEREAGMQTIHKMSDKPKFRADKICGCHLLHSEHMLKVKSLSFQKWR